MNEMCDFRLLYFAGSSREFLQARKYLTSLRWFVKEKFLESRRALRAHTQISKTSKYDKMYRMILYILI